MKPNHRLYASGLTFVLFAATGCSSSTDEASAPKASEEAPVVAAASQAKSGLQSCDELGRVDVVAGPSVTTTCQIKLTGLDEGLFFIVDLSSGEVKEDGMAGDDAMVRVTRMMGEDEHQIIEETPVTLLVPPEYKDINGDGEADVLITTDMGNVNASYGVWLGSPDGSPYYRAGDISGDFGAPTADGYITSTSRGSANSQCIGFYNLTEQQLGLVASVCVTALDEEATKTTCELDDASGIAAVNLTEAAAKAKFCAEPAAVNVYQ